MNDLTKYSKKALDAAEDSVAIGHRLTNQRIAIAVFDTLERAPWWEEVTDGNTVVPAGCPVRGEVATGDATERTHESPFTAWTWLGKARVFIDTRWTPPPPPLAVGDVIESDCEEGCPTDGVGIVDALGTVAQMFDGDIMWANGGEDEWGTLLHRHLPLTVIYVPKVGGDDD